MQKNLHYVAQLPGMIGNWFEGCRPNLFDVQCSYDDCVWAMRVYPSRWSEKLRQRVEADFAAASAALSA